MERFSFRTLLSLLAVLIAATNVAAQTVIIADTPAASGPSDKTAMGKEAEWIWSPAHAQDSVPGGDCYFRKSFTASPIRRAEIHIAADNAYELYVNGKLLGRGSDWRAMDIYN